MIDVSCLQNSGGFTKYVILPFQQSLVYFVYKICKVWHFDTFSVSPAVMLTICHSEEPDRVNNAAAKK